MKRLPLLFLFSLLSLSACNRGGLPDGVVDQDKMVDFLTDAYLIEGSYSVETRYRHDVLPEHVIGSYDSILAVHGLTREQAERSIDYYTRHLELYRDIQDSVVARLERRADEI